MADVQVAPATPSVAVQIGFDVAGVPQNIGTDYDAITWTDVTAYVRPEPAVTFNRGRAAAGEAAAAGQLQVTVLNDAGDFTPGDNGGSYGAIHPRMPIRVLGDAGGYDPEFYGDDYASREVLWVGFVTDIEWLIDSGQPLVTFTASDIIATAARTKCGPWLDKRIRTLTGSGLVNYWPLTDPAPNGLGNATTTTVPLLAGEQLLSALGGTNLTLVGPITDAVACNVPTGGLSPDGQPNIALTPGTAGGGFQGSCAYLSATATISTGEFAVSMWLRSEDMTNYGFPLVVKRSSGFTWVDLINCYTGGGDLTAYFEGGAFVTAPSVASVGEWFHVYFDLDGSTASCYINGTLVDTASTSAITSANYSLSVGGIGDVGWSGQIAHVAVWNSSDTTRAAALADRGTSLPTAADRFTDLVYVTANPSGLATWLDADTQADRTVSAQATNGKSLLALGQEVADAERGSVVSGRDGRLTLLSQRGNAAADPVLTLSAETDILSIDGLFGIDDADAVNEATVTLQPSGRVFTVTRSSDPGVESTSVDLWSTEDALAQSLAAALANASSITPRAPSLTISMDWLAHADMATAALLLDLGDTITVTDLPASAPASSLTVQVRAISHTISRASWQLQVDTDPPLYLAVLDDATYGLLDDTAILGV